MAEQMATISASKGDDSQGLLEDLDKPSARRFATAALEGNEFPVKYQKNIRARRAEGAGGGGGFL
jgi:hypothetical protein